MGDELKELKDHIKRQLSKGYKADEIRSALVGAGFSSHEVSEAFKQFAPKKTPLLHRLFKPKKAIKKIETEKKPAKNKKEKNRQLAGKKPSEETPSLFRIFRQTSLQECELPARQAPKALPAPEKMHLALPPPPAPSITHHRRMRTYLVVIITVIILTAAILFFFSGCMTEACFMDKANKCEPASFKNTIKGTGVRYEANNCVLIKTVTSLSSEEPPEIVDAFLGKSMACRYQMNNFNPLYLSTITGLLNTCEGPLKEAVLQHVV